MSNPSEPATRPTVTELMQQFEPWMRATIEDHVQKARSFRPAFSTPPRLEEAEQALAALGFLEHRLPVTGGHVLVAELRQAVEVIAQARLDLILRLERELNAALHAEMAALQDANRGAMQSDITQLSRNWRNAVHRLQDLFLPVAELLARHRRPTLRDYIKNAQRDFEEAIRINEQTVSQMSAARTAALSDMYASMAHSQREATQALLDANRKRQAVFDQANRAMSDYLRR